MATKEIKSEVIGVRLSLEQKTKFKKLAKEKRNKSLFIMNSSCFLV